MRELGIYEDGTVLRARPRQHRLKENVDKKKKKYALPSPLSRPPITVTTTTTTDTTSTDTSVMTIEQDYATDVNTTVNTTPSMVVAASTNVSGDNVIRNAPAVAAVPTSTPMDISTVTGTIAKSITITHTDNSAMEGKGTTNTNLRDSIASTNNTREKNQQQ